MTNIPQLQQTPVINAADYLCPPDYFPRSYLLEICMVYRHINANSWKELWMRSDMNVASCNQSKKVIMLFTVSPNTVADILQ